MGDLDVFVGAQTGFLKGVSLSKDRWQNINSITSLDKKKEIISMCWGNKDESEVCYGTKDQHVQIYKTDTHPSPPAHLDLSGGEKDNLVGLIKYQKGFVTCTDRGLVRVWSEIGNETLKKNVGDGVEFLRQNPSEEHLISTGGKENEIKVWDLNSQGTNVFTAKNLKNDWLDLRVPVWPTDMLFVPQSKLLCTTTAYHQTRLYDTRAQKRPVVEVLFKDSFIKSISLNHLNHQQVVVGNSQGMVGLLDFKGRGQLVHTFSGFMGGVKVVRCALTSPLLLCGGLDRSLMLFHLHSRKLLWKTYIKAPTNDLLMRRDVTVENVKKNQIPRNAPIPKKKAEVLEKEELKDLWEDMEVVQTKKTKKKSRQQVLREMEENKKKHLENLHQQTKTKKRKRNVCSDDDDDDEHG